MAAAPSAASLGASAPAEAEDLTERIMEYQRREYILLSRMAQRERSMRKLQQQANEAVDAYEDSLKDSLRGAFVDPVMNIELAMLRQQAREKEQEIARLKQEARGAQFQPNSIQGQKLLMKCRALLDENAELGRQLGEERMQALRIQLTAERRRRSELKQRILEFERHADQVDAENERLQKKIAELGQSLKVTRAEIDQHKKDIEDFRSGGAVKRKREGEKRVVAAAGAVAVASPAAVAATPALAPGEVPMGVAAEAAEADDGGDKKKKKKKKDKAK